MSIESTVALNYSNAIIFFLFWRFESFEIWEFLHLVEEFSDSNDAGVQRKHERELTGGR